MGNLYSNSRYSTEGDVTYAPATSTIQGVTVEPVKTTEQMFQLPIVNENIETPNGTPGLGILPNIAAPAYTVGTKIDVGDIHTPPATKAVE